ncbi:MAG: DUF4331 domain-containing protein [Erythrobacter sp.]|nr:DUF4331 domain-containing protein [Erythrobacter sp.]NCQ62420.1 DUF4331 domain-containing protein [Alphaproteobacteria bacterium]
MNKLTLGVAGLVLAASATGVILMLPGDGANSADHLDPPGRTSAMADDTPDRAADIADILAWADSGDLNVAVTFAGPAPANNRATYDRDVLYRVFISTDGDATTSEETVEVRFGQDGANQYGVQAIGIPGAGTISGPVETTLTGNGVTLRAGLFDDPFFFDLQGFQETVDTGTLSFDNQRDFFAGQNVTAFVFQVPVANLNATGPISVWVETRRFGGNL